MPTSPPTLSLTRSKDPACTHRPGCLCRRPILGRALVFSVIVEFVLALVTIAAGSPLVGLVACGAMSLSMVLAVAAETVAFHRVGQVEPDRSRVMVPGNIPPNWPSDV